MIKEPSHKMSAWLVLGLGLLLLLSPVQDSLLQATPLRVAGASPSFLVLVMILLIFSARALVSGGWLRYTIPPWMFIYFIAFVLVNIYYAAAFDFEAHGENLLIKGAKIAILLGALAAVGWLFASYALPRFSLIVRLSYGVALGGMLLDIAFHEFLVNNIWVHGSNIMTPLFDIVDNRPHGFSVESSTLSITLSTLGLLCASTARSGRSRWLWVILTFASVLPVNSKAGPILMVVSFVSALFLRGVSFRLIANSVGVVAVALVLGQDFWRRMWDAYVIAPFLYDIESGTSVATRITLWVGALATAFKHPWGVGFSGYLPAVVQSIDFGGAFAELLLDMPLNLSEAGGYVYQDTAYAIGTKSLFLDCLLVFGLPFCIFWIWAHAGLVKKLVRLGEVVPLALLLMLAFSLMTYISGVGLYPIAIAYGWLFRRVRGDFLASIPLSQSLTSRNAS
jgi:hypothetical protein